MDQTPIPDGAASSLRWSPASARSRLPQRAPGAPIGHDFCAISLSDLLTPWPAIAQRLRAAAEADFVVALYNPASGRRRIQLTQALTILATHRPADCPVVVARNLGREGEAVSITTLDDLETDAVDMLTVIVVGSSQTRQLDRGGRAWLYTPRGYEAGADDEAAPRTAKPRVAKRA